MAPEDGIAGLFDRLAPDYDQAGPAFFAYFGRRLAALAGLRPGMRVLDVATGRGAVLLPAAVWAGPVGMVVGIDLSSGMMRFINGAGAENIHLCRMDAQYLAFRAGSFDAVLCGNAIFYFPQAARGFLTVLRPGGVVGLSIVARGSIDWIIEELRPFAPDRVVTPENPETAIDTERGLENLLAGAGFCDVRVRLEEQALCYPDLDTWFAMLHSIGLRGTLETLSAEDFAAYRARIAARLEAYRQPGGFAVPFQVWCAFGRKPKESRRGR